MRNFFLLLAMSVVFLSSIPAYADSLCFPAYWGGLLPGESGERESRKLYGDGYYLDKKYARQRTYFNEAKSHTLTLTFGTDNFLTDLLIAEGLVIPEGLDKDKIDDYSSDWFNPTEGFGKWHRLVIGASKEDALKWLGKPDKESDSEWIFHTRCSCELQSGITLNFEGSNIKSIRFWASQG